MKPNIQSGDLIIYSTGAQEIIKVLKGSIVVLNNPLNPSSLIVKRIHDINSRGIEIRGDNPSSSIDSRQFGLINPESIIGVVKRIIRTNID